MTSVPLAEHDILSSEDDRPRLARPLCGDYDVTLPQEHLRQRQNEKRHTIGGSGGMLINLPEFTRVHSGTDYDDDEQFYARNKIDRHDDRADMKSRWSNFYEENLDDDRIFRNNEHDKRRLFDSCDRSLRHHREREDLITFDDLICDSDDISEVSYSRLPDPLVKLPGQRTSTCDNRSRKPNIDLPETRQTLNKFKGLSLLSDDEGNLLRRAKDRRTRGYFSSSDLRHREHLLPELEQFSRGRTRPGHRDEVVEDQRYDYRRSAGEDEQLASNYYGCSRDVKFANCLRNDIDKHRSYEGDDASDGFLERKFYYKRNAKPGQVKQIRNQAIPDDPDPNRQQGKRLTNKECLCCSDKVKVSSDGDKRLHKTEAQPNRCDDEATINKDTKVEDSFLLKRKCKEWIKLERYDGSTSLDTYLAHFQNCNDYNRWNEADRVAHLRASLTGNAAQVLWGLSATETTFESLTQKLKQRFGSAGQMAKYRAELRTRRRGKTETLQSLYQDIRRLLVLAYPGDSSPSSEAIAMESFLQALDDKDFELRLCEREFDSLDEIFRYALRLEANDRAINSRHDMKRPGGNQVRGLVPDREFDHIRQKLELVLAGQERSDANYRHLENECCQLKKMIMKQPNSTTIVQTEPSPVESSIAPRQTFNNRRPGLRSFNIKCFNCGELGHRAAICTKPRAQGTQRSDSNLPMNPVGSSSQDDNTNAVIQQSGRIGGIGGSTLEGREVYISMMLDGKPRTCLLDTGCELSIVPRSLVEGRQLFHSDRRMKAANGTEILIDGETTLDFELGPLQLPADVLVSEHVSEIMLGYDWLRANEALWDFKKQEIIVNDIAFPLSSREELGWCRRILVQTDTVIPSRCEMDIAGKMLFRKFIAAEGWMTDASEIKTGVCSARTIVPDQCKDIPVRIVNVMDQPVHLKAGLIVSELQAVEVIEINDPEVTISNSEHLNSMLKDVDETVPRDIQDRLQKLVHMYRHVFSKDEYDLGRAKFVQHHINTGQARPFKQTLRRQPDKYLEIIDQQVEMMKKQGLIEDSQSDWASNVVLAKKKDGSLRFCLDYRQLNSRTVKDTYPLPLISYCLDALGGSKWYSTFDLRSGYHQVIMAPEDAEKTTFLTRRGAFKFKVMPFGLTAAPATFQRLMDAAMTGVNFSICLIYLDDIIVFSKDLDEHLLRLEIIFKRLEAVNLKLKPSKCRLLRQVVTFLGHRISSEGVSADPAKCKTIEQWPEPRCIKDVRIFLGLCSYYRKMVKGFAEKANPMYELLKKNRPFVWDEACHDSFILLKTCLMQPPILSMPIDDGKYILDTDCSGQSAGAVLSQIQDGCERVIAYASRSLSKAERNYCITRQELLSVVFFVKYFRCYLLGRHFLLRTDHAALRWLRNTPEPIGQQARWLEILEEFSFDIEHRPGRLHRNADAMTRIPCTQCGMEPIEKTDEVRAVKIKSGVLENVTVKTDERWSNEALAEATRKDPELVTIYQWKTGFKEPPDHDFVARFDESTKIYWRQWSRIILKDGTLYRQWLTTDGLQERLQLIPPIEYRQEILTLSHGGITGGHLSSKKMKDQVQRRAYWTGWANDVEQFCKSCPACAQYHRGGLKRRGKLQEMLVGSPGERISIDITGKHPKSRRGNSYILTVIDHFTKFADGFPIPNHEATTVAKVLINRWIVYYGTPLQILSDKGAEFEGHLFAELCKAMAIDKARTTAYKPSTNACVERFHRTLNSMLGKVVCSNHRDWDERLPYVLAAYRSTRHESTQYSPNFLTYLRENRAPIDLLLGDNADDTVKFDSYHEYVAEFQEKQRQAYELVRQQLKRCAERRKKHYDLRAKPEEFKSGQWIWYFCPRRIVGRSPKWSKFYSGPWLILKMLGPVNAVIQRSKNTHPIVVHIDKLKPCFGKTPKSWLEDEQSCSVPDPVVLGEQETPVLEQPSPQHSGAENETEFEEPIIVNPRRPKRNTRKPARFCCRLKASEYLTAARQKNRFLNMSLEEKRKFYLCNDRYVELNEVPSWLESFRENSETLPEIKPNSSEPGFDVDTEINDRVCIWQGDITTLEVDVVVNVTNEHLTAGEGINGYIHHAAGKGLTK